MTAPAARLLDDVTHSEAKTGFLTGLAIGLAVGVAVVAVTVATGGAALAVVAAAGAGVATAGGGALLGKSLGETVTTVTGKVVQIGSPNVFVNSRPAARAVLDGVKCSHHPGPQPTLIAQGSGSVFVNSKPAARKGDLTQCSAKLAKASPNVLIGGPTVDALPITPEVPESWTTAATIAIYVGSAVALGAGALMAYAGAGVCGLIGFAGQTLGGLALGTVGSAVGGRIGEALFGERGRIIGEALGGAAGGWAGSRLGGRLTAGHPVDVASGELFTEQTDFAVPGVLPLVWSRVWISSSPRGRANGGPLGEGWHHTFDAALVPVEGGPDDCPAFAARMDDGRLVVFTRPSRLRPAVNTVEGLVLGTDGRGAYWLEDYDGLRRDFGPADPATGVRPIARVADRHGNAIALEYAGSRLVALVDTAGRRFTLEHDRAGRITAVDGPHPEWPERRQRLVAYTYDDAGDLVRAEDARGSAFTYRYDRHLMVEEVRPAGVAFQFVWDDAARGRRARCVDTWGRRPSAAPGVFPRPVYRAVLAYDAEARTTVVTDGEGARRRYRWNALDLVEEEVDALGHATRTAYDAAGRAVAVTGPDGRTARRQYDDLGRLVLVAGGDGPTRYAYASDAVPNAPPAEAGVPLGRVARVTLPDGSERAFAYDARGALAAETDPTGRTTRYVRDARGLVTRVEDGAGVAARYHYGSLGALVAEGPEEAPARRYTHDRLGRVASVQRGRDLPLRLRRDAAGDVVSVTRGGDAVVALEYDADGHVTLHRDALGRTTRWRYDGLPFPVERVNADGTRVRYAYDSELRLTALTNAKGERYRLAYDPAGQLREETGFDGRTLRYTLDAAGRLTETWDAGRVTKYVRDAAGRLEAKEFADGTAHRYGWNANGRLARAESPDAVVSYAYDAAGRVLEERQETADYGAQPVRYRYDARGRLSDTVLPDGRVIAIEYGAEGDLFAAVSLDGEELARVERDEAGREVARQAGTVRQEQEFDPQGRLVRQSGVAGGSRAVFARRYGYDAADQLVRLTDGARGERTYQYDMCERLLSVGGSAPERFVVDPAGNILARDASGPEGDAAPGDRLLRYRDGGEERTFAYDAWGNRVRETRAVGGVVAAEVAYRYDAGDVLREVQRTERDGSRRVTRFGYDALGRRVWKATARLTAVALVAVGAAAPAGAGAQAADEPLSEAWARTAFVWDGDVLLAESERPREDALAAVYVYEPDTFHPLAVVRRTAHGAPGAVYRYHLDHLGTPQELTAADGRMAWSADYRAWGALAQADAGRVAQPLRFQGQYADAETELHYNRFRYYSPADGRFVNQDPMLLAGGANVSEYAPNPTSWVDPYGLAKKHITYLGTKHTPTGPKPYAGYASGPSNLTPEQVLSRRYSGDFSKFAERPNIIYSGDSKPIARGLEQRSFERMGGLDGTANAENPVGPRNPNRSTYLAAADEHLKNSPATQRQIDAMKPDADAPAVRGGCKF